MQKEWHTMTPKPKAWGRATMWEWCTMTHSQEGGGRADGNGPQKRMAHKQNLFLQNF
jgi:hypothetical protein